MRQSHPLLPWIFLTSVFWLGCGGDPDLTSPPPPAGSDPVAFSNWSWLNPRPQGLNLNGLAVLGSKVIAVGDNGTVVLGDPASPDWRALSPQCDGTMLTDVGFVSEELVIAVGFDGTYRSEDGGESWVSVDDTRDHRDLAIRGKTVIAVGPRPVFSLDGRNFRQGAYDHLETMTSVSFLDDTTAVAVSPSRVLKTFDSGRRWEVIVDSPDLRRLVRVAFADSEIGVMADGLNHLYRTENAGENWTEVGQVVDSVVDIKFFGLDLGFLLTKNHRIYKSFDAGRTWDQLTAIANTDDLFSAVVHLGNDSFLTAGTRGMLLRTDNGGANWTSLLSGVHLAFRDLEFLSPTMAVASAGDEFGNYLARSVNGGRDWVLGVLPVERVSNIEFFDQSFGVILNSFGVVVKTTDGGANWTATGAESREGGFVGLAFFDSDTWVITGESSTIMRTTDGGTTWTVELSETDGPRLTSAAVFPGTSAGVVLGPDRAVITLDSGDSWVLLGSDAPLGARVVTCPSSQVAIAVGDAIYRSEDQGRTWRVVFSGRDTFLEDIAFHGELHGLATGRGGLAYETLDGGLSWSEIKFTQDRLRTVAFRDANSVVAAGNGAMMLGTVGAAVGKLTS